MVGIDDAMFIDMANFIDYGMDNVDTTDIGNSIYNNANYNVIGMDYVPTMMKDVMDGKNYYDNVSSLVYVVDIHEDPSIVLRDLHWSNFDVNVHLVVLDWSNFIGQDKNWPTVGRMV